MSFDELSKAEKKIKREENRIQRVVVTSFLALLILLAGLGIAMLFSGCTIKMVPAGSVHQAELQRRIAILSYRDGLAEGLSLHDDQDKQSPIINPYTRKEEK